MQELCRLLKNLEDITEPSARQKLLEQHLAQADPTDLPWTLFVLNGFRGSRLFTKPEMHALALHESGFEPWLFEQSLKTSGDLAETAAQILPDPKEQSEAGVVFWMNWLLELRAKSKEDRDAELVKAWHVLDSDARYYLNRWVLGSWRPQLSQQLISAALARHTKQTATIFMYRMRNGWTPNKTDWTMLTEAPNPQELSREPVALPLIEEIDINALPEDTSEWAVAKCFEGLRCQLLIRNGTPALWSEEHAWLGDQFPEVLEAAHKFPDQTHVEGWLLGLKDGTVLPMESWNKRLTQKKVTPASQREMPVVFVAADLLSEKAVRASAKDRLMLLKDLTQTRGENSPLLIYDYLRFETKAHLLAHLKQLRQPAFEGFLMRPWPAQGPVRKLRRLSESINAVLLYVSRDVGFGKSTISELTVGVWHEGDLLPIGKVQAALSDAVLEELEAFAETHTLERFGPVRSVEPSWVVTVEFEQVKPSSRHKAGLTLEHSKVVAYLREEEPAAAAKLEDLMQLMQTTRNATHS